MKIIDQLAYHGQLPVLVAAVEIAWPVIRESSDIVSWGVEEFAQDATDFIIFDYLEKCPDITAEAPALLARLNAFPGVEAEKLQRYIGLLSGRQVPALEDTDFAPNNESHRQSVIDLSIAFMAYLKQTEQVSYSKGKLAQALLLQYLLESYNTCVKSLRRANKKKIQQKPIFAERILCPERRSLERFLAPRLDFLSVQFYRVAAVFELIPAWLHFLQARQLISADAAQSTLSQLAPLYSDLLRFYRELRDDPVLFQMLEDWP